MGKFQILHTRGTKPKLQNYVLILEIYGRLLECMMTDKNSTWKMNKWKSKNEIDRN